MWRLQRAPSAARRFADSQSGTIAVLFALLLVPILGIVFGGIDYSRAMSVQSQLQTAADAAATSAASRLAEGRSQAETAFKAAFRANLPKALRDQPYELSIAGNASRLSVELTTSVPTTMVALLGVSKLDVAVAATAERPDPLALARSKGGGGGMALDGLPATAEGARARHDIERALRSAGLPAPKAPDQREIEEARRQMQDALRAVGLPANLPRQDQVLDPTELERMQRQIMQELSRLRF
ncbi:MAG: pilus assembly protein [Alphaproteobacteria bacterium]|nr:pilus assembly protein [Alphaproteobacteria bacterium]